MIKHVICFKLKEGAEESRKQVREVLAGMEGRVPQIRDVAVHLDELRSPRSFDVILEVLVDSWEALESYQKDEYHCEVVKKYLNTVVERSVAMDFEV
ncbi:MAG: Dabb family protein [Clostridia bacterium]|nr:Dabb family protein [Clostridia bacterium]